jgi:hypothetical protein
VEGAYMEKSKKPRSMALTLLIVAGITVLAVLVSAGVQILVFGKTVTAVTTAVGVVTGMAAAWHMTRKPAE